MADLSRSLQLKMLQAMEEFYPRRVDLASLEADFPNESVYKNLHYLAEHGLIDVSVDAMMDGEYAYGDPRINERGMDFLADDGGLAAILGVITVKLHDETIRALLEKTVKDSDEDASVKAKAIAAIREAPAEAIKQVSEFALRKGLESLPGVAPLLQILAERQ